MSLLIDDPAAPVAPALAAVSGALVELLGVELWRLDDKQTTAAVGAATMVDTGDELSPAAARRLACDAQLIPAVLAGQGAVLDIGWARRTFHGPLRTAVIGRDHGCVHPAATAPPAGATCTT